MINVLVMGLTDVLGGVETYIYNLVTNSDRSLIHFDFLCQGRTNAVFREQIEEFYEGDVDFFFVPTYKKGKFNCIGVLKEIYKRDYDIVYVNACISTDLLYAIPYIKKGRTKLVVHSHVASLDRKQLQHKLFRKIVANSPDLRLACSQMAADFFWKKRQPATIIPNGINVDHFRFDEEARRKIREDYKIEENELVLGNVGRLTYQKNQVFLIGILKGLIEKGIEAKLLLVGDGEDRDMIEELIKENNLSEQIILCGMQRDIAKFYSSFDIFVMPSISEGFGIAGIEAQASGLFCLLSDTMDRRLLLTDRVRMLRLCEDNHSEWVDAIIEGMGIDASNRMNYVSYVKESGYDLNDTVQTIQNIFINLQKE